MARPKLYNSAEELADVIDSYFARCKAEDEPLTISGLAMALGMTTQSLRNYEKNEEFFSTVNAAKQQVERFLETRLYESSATGAIFSLKNNFGWKDQKDHTVGSPDGGPLQILVQGVPGNAPS